MLPGTRAGESQVSDGLSGQVACVSHQDSVTEDTLTLNRNSLAHGFYEADAYRVKAWLLETEYGLMNIAR